MSKLLEGIRFRRHWVALGGALGSLLAAAGRDLPQWYVMGVSGHAFRLSLDLVISPSAPVDLNFHEVLPLWENLGAWFARTAAKLEDPGFAETRAAALTRIRESIDRGLPAIAFDLLDLPEYGLVVGYDDERLACLTLNNDESPEWMAVAPWPAVEHASFTRAEAITLLDLAPEFDRRHAEVASLRFAVDHFWQPESRDHWLRHGKKAYEYWAMVLSSPVPMHGDAPGVGVSYNLMVLQRARQDAAQYLADLASRYPEAPSLGRAAERFAEAAAAVDEATKVLPFPGGDGLNSSETKKRLADWLRRALAAEQHGIDEIERSLRALR